ncbi:BTE_HP_G0136330.mRNA.1.CDS.1 [Saccharomyces cerevisiae]|nr:BTE_HP_G0136330.mRNA.1.CDS.1 [Saccharomyces cerevisiae]CAI7000419.1 BTE_HP_G0136330.mRNA.1.CDS.1 [Saccharomyces cerevisiae]
MQGCQRCSSSVSLLGWPESIVSGRIAWEALAVERMLQNSEEYKRILAEDIEPYHGDPVGYLKYFSVKERSTLRYRELCLVPGHY